MNNEAITISDCLDMFEKKGQVAVIEKGHVTSFVKEGDETYAERTALYR